MNDFINEMTNHPNGTELIFIWKDGLKIKAQIDTMYDTDNGLELDEEGYEEYHACLVKVTSIMKESEILRFNIEENKFLEISDKNAPDEIQLENGETIWKLVE